AALLLNLDEPENRAAPDDEVELVACRPRVRPEDLPAAQPVPPERLTLGALPRAFPRQLPPPRNNEPRSCGDAPPTGRCDAPRRSMSADEMTRTATRSAQATTAWNSSSRRSCEHCFESLRNASGRTRCSRREP